ncbi:hypothetical protein Ahy_A08g038926 [Arachis hypogaea]|uniref:Uncharacterized protein n=1 Tax=Arachis hypogaea TaxID=3818 RepID=A0A445BV32_ARAHY|nr:hypothetical protein Ahy_A08g038926 [Arachis hypogaea]
MRKESATSSSPYSAVFARIIPIPPAFFTTKLFSTLGFPPRSHTTILPETLLLIKLSLVHRRKSRSIVPAPTVVIHGATLDTDASLGPLFPAELDTRIPCAVAANVPIAIMSLE